MFNTAPARSLALRSLVTVATLLLVGTSCVAPYKVREQADPNPFVGQTTFAYRAATFEDLRVGRVTEAQYLSDKPDERKVGWEKDKQAVATRFLKGVRKGTGSRIELNEGGEGFTVQPHVEWIEPGIFTGFAFGNKAGSVLVAIRILDANGDMIDEVEVTGVYAGSIYEPTITQRLRGAAALAGANFAKYLKKRVKE
jgi:hypothetical protein